MIVSFPFIYKAESFPIRSDVVLGSRETGQFFFEHADSVFT